MSDTEQPPAPPPPKVNQFYLPEWLTVELIASNFITFTPLFSYGTTIFGIYKKQTSLGFSIDICATMLVAAMLRIAYYFIIPYEIALLRQSIVMVCIQSVLLKVSLNYRPKSYDMDFLVQGESLWKELGQLWDSVWRDQNANLALVLVGVKQSLILSFIHSVRFFNPTYKRMGHFWQWNSEKYYWRFVIQFAVVLTIFTALLQDFPRFGSFLGTVGLFIESLLPLPQILLLNNLKSIEGFKLLLLLSWLCGDCTKISYLIFGAKNISALFLIFAIFQMLLDFYIAFQYIYFKYYYIPDAETIEMREMKI